MARYGFGGGSDGADAANQEENFPGGGASAAATGGGGIGVADVNHLWAKRVPDEEKARVAALEMVDEVEEWELLAAHYCVVWAWRDGEAAAGDEGNRAEGESGGDGDEVTTGAKGTGAGKGKGVWEGWRDVVGQDV